MARGGRHASTYIIPEHPSAKYDRKIRSDRVMEAERERMTRKMQWGSAVERVRK